MQSGFDAKITILTDPIADGTYLIPQTVRIIARTVRDWLRPREKKLNNSKYRGHFAVTRSLVEGLEKMGLPFNHNPRSISEVADVVVVLAGVRTLRQAIQLKRTGKIKKLFAGPNIVSFASDVDFLIGAPEIHAAITPSDWVREKYVRDIPTLRDRCISWPAGVDTAYWDSNPKILRSKILIFDKLRDGEAGPVEPFHDYVRKRGHELIILKYGKYSHTEYLEALQQAKLMIGFSRSESQGIAWAEAWSVDVPTLIWKNSADPFRGRNFNRSTAPYLGPENGLFFEDFDDFKDKFSFWETDPQQFSPRAWVLESMSDEVCASRLYKEITAF